MKRSFSAPPFTKLASLEQIARNVSSASISNAAQLNANDLEIESNGTYIRWHHGNTALSFPMRVISALHITQAASHGQNFIALSVRFTSGEENLSYLMIVSHESEAAWLGTVAASVGQLFGLPVGNSKGAP